MKALFDTNILIDYLNGRREAAKEIAKHSDRLISRITWMETMAGVPRGASEEETRQFLDCFTVAELSQAIAERAVVLRRQHALKLPDAIILATARKAEALLLTRNTKDFDPAWPEVREPYRLT